MHKANKVIAVAALLGLSAFSQTWSQASLQAQAQAPTPSYQPVADQPLPLAGAMPTSTGAPLRDVAAAAPPVVTSTTEKIDGYHIRRYLGIVRGVKVFQPTVGQNLKAGLRSLVGGSIASYADMCERARSEAYDQMMRRATDLGANAIVGIRFDTAGFGSNGADVGTEVICYGTAVSLEADR